MRLPVLKPNTLFICLVLLLCLFQFSCEIPTYNQTNKKSYEALLNSNYNAALTGLENNSYLKQKYNKVLYQIEKGRILLLTGNYLEGFKQLEEADKTLDAWNELKEKDVAGAVHIQTVTETKFGNYSSSSYYKPFKEIFKAPRKVDYRPSHYERILIHYYKAICLIKLNKLDEAEVEAKQLDQLSHNLDDLKNAEPNTRKYVSNALPQILSGIIYELQLDDNSALIEYENAWKKLLDAENRFIYGVSPPNQLKEDILRLSYRMSFDDKLTSYQQDFNIRYQADTTKYYLIMLIDNGLSPIKTKDFSWYYSKYGNVRRGFDTKKNSVQFTKPEFINAPKSIDPIIKISCKMDKQPELICNVQHVTNITMNKRYQYQTDHYIKESFKADTVFKAPPANIYCDTRNWQSIPQQIEYAKVPINAGYNRITITFRSGKQQVIEVTATKRNSFYYLAN